MTTLQLAMRFGGLAWIAAAVAIVAYGLLTGAMNMRGLLCNKTAEGLGSLSPERVLVLISTLTVATTYLGQVFSTPASHSLPVLPPVLLGAVGGTNVIYVARKAFKMFQHRRASRGT